MKKVTRKLLINASTDAVFEALNDLGITGMHMSKSSAMMIGSRLTLEYLTDHHRGLGTKYRWSGTMLWLKMDFMVEVTKWSRGREKTWETIGESKMIIYSWYRIRLSIKPNVGGSEAELSISYEKTHNRLARIISLLLADWYCNWCLKHMLQDAKRIIMGSGM